MANNGFLSGDTCLTPSQYAITYCVGKPTGFNNTSTNGFICDATEKWVRASPSVYNCEILGPPAPPLPSTIPTVADGITLGWQAGAALILVGCILFLKKALK